MAEDDIKLVMFCCNWCSYGGADTAGTARMQYPPNVRVIRVMCSGRIEPQFIFKAFREGADGVIVAGCPMVTSLASNYKLDRRMRLIYKRMGWELVERIHHDWISASEGKNSQIL